MKKVLLAVLALIVIFVGMALSGYNSLVTLNENVNGKWSQIENQLQRRADLIPNLVNTVKGYASHESEVFTQVLETVLGEQKPQLIDVGDAGEACGPDGC